MAVSGILSSRVGCGDREPSRVLVRGPADMLPDDAACRLAGPQVAMAPLRPWGARWGSSWWIAEFTGLAHGTYQVDCAGRRGDPLVVGADPLWERCWQDMAIAMPQRRARIAKVKPGWYDAGNLWQEANAHACLVLGLCDVLEHRAAAVAPRRDEIRAQVATGLDYLGLCQDAGERHGHGAGGLCHDLLGNERVLIPGDMAKSAAAWARGARLAAATPEQAAGWRGRAMAAVRWFDQGRHLGAFGFAAIANGARDGWVPPPVWRSEDLAVLLGACAELARDDRTFLDRAAAIARELRARQVRRDEAEDGLWGHQFSFADRSGPTQKAWTHCFHGGMGQDLGCVFPFWVLPLIELHRAFPGHPDAAMWRDQVADLGYGFLLPACGRNPFGICPMGVWPGQGLLDFGAMWHGGNAVYGYTAAQCFALAGFLDDPAFARLGHANLQWIAGCNAGITAAARIACHMTTYDCGPDEALPASMICGIGDRTAGNWLNIRGSICNGFATGDQFVFDVPPAQPTDGPHTLSDEDWITHTGAFLAGMARSR